MRRAVTAVVAFFGPVEGAIRGHLNPGELARVVTTAAFSGTGCTGVFLAVASAVARDPATFFVRPHDAALAAALATVLLEGRRRLRHGDDA